MSRQHCCICLVYETEAMTPVLQQSNFLYPRPNHPALSKNITACKTTARGLQNNSAADGLATEGSDDTGNQCVAKGERLGSACSCIVCCLEHFTKTCRGSVTCTALQCGRMIGNKCRLQEDEQLTTHNRTHFFRSNQTTTQNRVPPTPAPSRPPGCKQEAAGCHIAPQPLRNTKITCMCSRCKRKEISRSHGIGCWWPHQQTNTTPHHITSAPCSSPMCADSHARAEPACCLHLPDQHLLNSSSPSLY